MNAPLGQWKIFQPPGSREGCADGTVDCQGYQGRTLVIKSKQLFAGAHEYQIAIQNLMASLMF